MRVFLPFPPSLNKLWKPVARGKLVRTPVYRSWMNDAVWVVYLAAREQGKVRGEYTLNVWLHPQVVRRLRDADNFLKGPCDALVKGGAIEDDSLCQDLRVRWGEFAEPGILLEVEPCPNLLSPEDGNDNSPNEIAKSRTRRQRRLVATIQAATSGEASATGSQESKDSGSPRSSTPAANIACRKSRRKPETTVRELGEICSWLGLFGADDEA
jgi:Holliday junction resolvase RusA-like endonuclease